MKFYLAVFDNFETNTSSLYFLPNPRLFKMVTFFFRQHNARSLPPPLSLFTHPLVCRSGAALRRLLQYQPPAAIANPRVHGYVVTISFGLMLPLSIVISRCFKEYHPHVRPAHKSAIKLIAFHSTARRSFSHISTLDTDVDTSRCPVVPYP